MKKLKAQQITEFMLAAPILLIFFVILTEFAYAFNAHIFLSNATSSSFSQIIADADLDSSRTNYEKAIKTYVFDTLTANGLTGDLETKLILVDRYPVVISMYSYTPGFNYTFLPALKSFSMSSTAVFPFKLPNNNQYQGGVDLPTILTLIAPLPPGY